jgi:hypothetical protein
MITGSLLMLEATPVMYIVGGSKSIHLFRKCGVIAERLITVLNG